MLIAETEREQRSLVATERIYNRQLFQLIQSEQGCSIVLKQYKQLNMKYGDTSSLIVSFQPIGSIT